MAHVEKLDADVKKSIVVGYNRCLNIVKPYLEGVTPFMLKGGGSSGSGGSGQKPPNDDKQPPKDGNKLPTEENKQPSPKGNQQAPPK